MLTHLRLLNFKNFADETLRLGPFTVIVGANASGKSNVRDALRFLHGIGRGYTLADVLGGKYGAGGQVVWERIRGAPAEIVRHQQRRLTAEVAMRPANGSDGLLTGFERGVTFSVEIESADALGGVFRVAREELYTWMDSSELPELGMNRSPARVETAPSHSELRRRTIYTSASPGPYALRKQEDEHHLLIRMEKTGTQKKLGYKVAVRPEQPALTQLQAQKPVRKAHKDLARFTADALADIRFLDLSPSQMRLPSTPGQTVLGDSGENLPAVLKAICDDSQSREALLGWTRELTPMDVADFEFPLDPSGQLQLVIKEKDGKRTSAHSASDGTLRFLAILAALLGKNRPAVYVFEEIDNGIHPARLHLLIDLIESQTDSGDIQVVTTTHSPSLLSMINDETFKHTSVVCRCPETDNAVIRAICELPQAAALRDGQGLARLQMSGWFEDAVYLTALGMDDPP